MSALLLPTSQDRDTIVEQMAVQLYRFDGNTTPWHATSEATQRRYLELARVGALTYEDAWTRLVQSHAHAAQPSFAREATEDVLDAHRRLG